ncbi:hypothetical protein BC833DRAFT_597574 [Globomyces pollinis-pini]|nr:hypothetical protein BC833DRAFT_597574 [Globomyces pollinis-pini]
MIYQLGILFSTSYSRLIYQSFWDTMYDCEGPPYLMGVFDLDTSPESNLNYFCGYNPIPANTGCCISQLKRKNLDGYHSISVQYVIDPDDEQAPYSANGYSYCKLDMFKNVSRENDFDVSYLLADGKCHEGFRCLSNGTISNYEDMNCTKLMQEDNVFQSTTVQGNYTVSFLTILNSKNVMEWTTYPYVTTIIFSHMLDYFGLLCVSLSFIFTIIACGRHINQFRKNQKQYHISSLLLYFCLLLSSSLNTVNWVHSCTTELSCFFLYEFKDVFENIATFLTVYDTIQTLLEYLHLVGTLTQKLALLVLVVVHLVLAGSNYVSYWVFIEESTTSIISRWSYLLPGWIIVMHIVDIVPPTYLIVKISKTLSNDGVTEQSTWRCLHNLFLKNRLLCVLYIFQFLNFSSFVILSVLTRYSTLLKDDLNWMAMTGPLSMTLVIHTIMNKLLMIEIRKIFTFEKEQRRRQRLMKAQGTINNAIEIPRTYPNGVRTVNTSEFANMTTRMSNYQPNQLDKDNGGSLIQDDMLDMPTQIPKDENEIIPDIHHL